MKQLTRIQADGLKNLSAVDLKVPQFLALAGPNGSGKTAILEAIRLGVLGYEPSLGKTLSLTRQLASNGEIEVGLYFDNGFGIHRTIGSSMGIELTPPEGEETLKAAESRIAAETGQFVPSFDLESFLALSAEKRKEYLFSLLPRELADLDDEVFRSWLGYGESETIVQKAIDKLWQEHVLPEASPIDGLASAIEFAHDRFLEAERARRSQVEVTEAAEADAIAASEQVEEDPERLDELQADLEVVTRKLGEISARRDERERAEKRIRERDHQIRVVDAEIKDVSGSIEDVEEALENTERPDLKDADALERDADELEPTIRELEQGIHDQRVEVSSIRSDIEDLHVRLEELREAPDTCPTCGQDMPEKPEGLEGKLVKQLQEREHRVDRLDDLIAQAKEKVDGLKDTAKVERENAEKIRDEASTYDRLSEQLDGKSRQLQSLREERQRLEDLEVDVPDPVDTDEENDLSEKAAYIRERIRQEREKARAAGKAEAARERADAERAKLENKTHRAEALKGLHAGLQKLRAHVIEQMVGPVEETANGLLQAIDSEKSFRFIFEREGRAEFDLGFEEDGVFRSYDAASTGEDAFLAVVLVAALISACSPPWPLLLVDNIEGVDERRRGDLMEALTTLSDRIGNVIVAGCCPFDPVDGWTIQDMRELVRAREEVAA